MASIEVDVVKAIEAFRNAEGKKDVRKRKSLDLFWALVHIELMHHHYAQKLFQELKHNEQAEIISLMKEFISKMEAR